MDVRVPNLGVDSATVLSILVKVGDSVTKEQSLVELETDKAVAPVPSPSAGKVASIVVKAGVPVMPLLAQLSPLAKPL